MLENFKKDCGCGVVAFFSDCNTYPSPTLGVEKNDLLFYIFLLVGSTYECP